MLQCLAIVTAGWVINMPSSQGFGGRSVHYPQGKTLGGGSARNLLWYQRSVVPPMIFRWFLHVTKAAQAY